jgi:hypothetical protein
MLVFVAFLMAAASAMAGDLKIHVLSDPPGALVYLTNRAGVESFHGQTPQEVKYLLVQEDKGCRDTKPLRVRWVSGAEATILTLHLCKNDSLLKTPFVFTRPAVPGVEVDAQYAIDLERNALLRQQAALQFLLASRLNQAAALTALPYVLPTGQTPTAPLAPMPVNCMSTLIGNTIYTTCQ